MRYVINYMTIRGSSLPSAPRPLLSFYDTLEDAQNALEDRYWCFTDDEVVRKLSNMLIVAGLNGDGHLVHQLHWISEND